jgi:hypothetical protein
MGTAANSSFNSAFDGLEAQLWAAAVERDNSSLQGALPKDYFRPGLDKQCLGQLVNHQP